MNDILREKPLSVVIHGDCVEVLGDVEGALDAIVTDPPYGLEFMGKKWDRLDWTDGGKMASVGMGRDIPWPSYSGTGAAGTANATCATCKGRMRGAQVCACEKPQWRVKGKALDGSAHTRRMQAQQAWHARWLAAAFRALKPGGYLLAYSSPRTYHRLACAAEDVGFEIRDCIQWVYGSGFPKSKSVAMSVDKRLGKIGHRGKAFTHAGDVSHLQSMEGKAGAVGQHDGLSPEAQRWQGWQTALKPAQEPILMARKPLDGTVAANVLKHGTGAINVDACRVEGGRWPSNLILSQTDAADCPVAELDRQWSDASRFFYTPKAPKREREAGCEDLPGAQQDTTRKAGSKGGDNPRNRGAKQRKNHHPTVKPIAIMEYLLKLVVPPGGVVVDPFLGSGTTLVAAARLGVRAVGIEREPAYIDIAKARIAHALKGE